MGLATFELAILERYRNDLGQVLAHRGPLEEGGHEDEARP